ncbi:hypothetical protein EJ110_NYTH03840 [Nymphaea thermarum]|nr:hypothetical protein EJ110_NYTH03840 [Nymphaea thermarum]
MAKKAMNWKRPGAAQEPANQALGSNRFKALQRNIEEGESLSSPQPVLEKPPDLEKQVGAISEQPTLMEAWIVGEEQSIRGGTNKRRRPLCPPQLASANTKHMASSNAIHGPKISAHKSRSRPLGRNAGSFKDGGSRNSLSSSAIKEYVEKPSLHGNDPDPQMALAFQAPPSWPIDPGDTSHNPTMEIDLGESGAGSVPVLPPGKEIAEHSKYNFVSNHDQADGRARVIARWNLVTIQVVDVIINRDWIGIIAKERQGSVTFASFGAYLHPNRLTRQHGLHTLGSSIRTVNLPTVVLGDFNAVRDSNDKSGRPPNSSSCKDFNQFIVDNNFNIVEDPRRHFTWSNNRKNSDTILCKLDWAMVNANWVLQVGDQNTLQILPRDASDHSALVLRAINTSCRRPQRSQFKFLKNWSLRGECEEVVKDGWSYQSSGCAFIRVLGKLEVTRSKLSVWNRIHYGNISAKIVSLQKELDSASLVSKKYLSNHSLWTRKGKAKDSWLWKGIEWGWDAISKEVRWSMGNGLNARAWLEDWGEGILLSKVHFSMFYILEARRSISVADLKTLIQEDNDVKRLTMGVLPHLNRVCLSQSQDTWQWKGLHWENVTWQLIWEDIRQKGNSLYWKKAIWNAVVPPRAQWYTYIASEGLSRKVSSGGSPLLSKGDGKASVGD